jgi:hypothetical protein
MNFLRIEFEDRTFLSSTSFGGSVDFFSSFCFAASCFAFAFAILAAFSSSLAFFLS